MKEQKIKIGEYTVALIRNQGVSIVQRIFTETQVVVVSIDDLKKIINLAKNVEG